LREAARVVKEGVTKTVTERCGMNLMKRLSVGVGVVEGKVNGYEGAV
jgi:hypothetical protein